MVALKGLEKYWILYDVANSAFVLLVSTIIPIYYKNMASNNGVSAADSTAYYSYALSISTIIVAILGPILGTIADNKGYKKKLFTFFMIIGVLGCAALSMPTSWVIFLSIFVVARVGFSSSLIFYDSMLIDITDNERMDKVSSYGYAFGYIGSCIPFIISLCLVLFGDRVGIDKIMAMSIACVLNAAWWFFVTIPLLKTYEQKYYVEAKEHAIKESFLRIKHVFKCLKSNKKVWHFLIAFFLYIDGVYTIIDMATSYGKDVGIGDSSMLVALLVTQIVAFPFAIIFGRLSKRFDTRKLISVCIIAYFFILLFAIQLDKAWEFWIMAILVAVFQGAIQALSRSYYAKIIPKNNSSEYFGIYDIFGKGASFMGTLLMGVSTQVFDSSKAGVIFIAMMFLIGWIIFNSEDKRDEVVNVEY